MFRFFVHGDPFSEAGRSIAKGSLFIGMLLIGFGMLVFVLRDLFAFLAAAVFFMAGFSAIGYGFRIFWTIWKSRRNSDSYRENVQIHNSDSYY